MDSSSSSTSPPLSFPSEGPDIRDLFSSYTYDSPQLNIDEDVPGLSSEPPDITDLFSSYVYESPALDDTIIHYNDCENDNQTNQYGLTPPLLKCARESHGIADINNKITDCQNHSPRYCQTSPNTSDRSFNFDETRILIDTNSVHAASKSTNKLFSLTEKFNAQHHPQDTNNKVSTTGRLDSTNQTNNKHPVKVHNRDNEKENYEIEFAEDGFVSTRKRKQNSSRRSPCPSTISITSATDSTSLKGDATGRRKVLSETTNIQRTTVSGTTGKWKCPQRSKPNLGPNLKQLRLEKWVHQS